WHMPRLGAAPVGLRGPHGRFRCQSWHVGTSATGSIRGGCRRSRTKGSAEMVSRAFPITPDPGKTLISDSSRAEWARRGKSTRRARRSSDDFYVMVVVEVC